MSENNSLFGPQFIQQLRSSGYKNPIYAMAEIIDNSVDAKATEIATNSNTLLMTLDILGVC